LEVYRNLLAGRTWKKNSQANYLQNTFKFRENLTIINKKNK
jgi:hypothetical protein